MPTSTGSTPSTLLRTGSLTTSALSVNKKGFTLIELLVVISIISILSVVGFVSYQNVSAKAKDARMRADIDSIKKAYETNYDPSANSGQGGYKPLSDSQFASGKIPTPPGGGSYSAYLGPGTTTDPLSGQNVKTDAAYKVCATLSNNTSTCASSTQGDTTLVNQLNSLSNPSCDPTGGLILGLVGYWKMDEGTYTSVADSSGNGGTLQFEPKAPTWTPDGKSGSALKMYEDTYRRYSGANTNSSVLYISGTQLSFGVWVYLTDVPPQYAGVIQRYSGEGGYRIYIGSNGRPEVQLYGNGISGGISGDSILQDGRPDGRWHFVMATYDGNAIKLYVDNRAPRISNFTQAIGSNTLFSVGGEESEPIHGYVDEARVYNRALSEQEVSALANGCMPL